MHSIWNGVIHPDRCDQTWVSFSITGVWNCPLTLVRWFESLCGDKLDCVPQWAQTDRWFSSTSSPGLATTLYCMHRSISCKLSDAGLRGYEKWVLRCVGRPVRLLQDTPASSECRQLCSPQALFGHCSNVSSLPVQRTSSSHTRPEPFPKCAWLQALARPLQREDTAQEKEACFPAKLI